MTTPHPFVLQQQSKELHSSFISSLDFLSSSLLPSLHPKSSQQYSPKLATIYEHGQDFLSPAPAVLPLGAGLFVVPGFPDTTDGSMTPF